MGVTTPVYHEISGDIDFMSLCSFGVTQLLLDKILPQLMIGNASHLIRVGYVYIYMYTYLRLYAYHVVPVFFHQHYNRFRSVHVSTIVLNY